ncbi:hypothetical protein GCM10009836_29290 [Pseudonocardia ailaonensis]|uniref:Serine/threonine protein kinase n=1 Tax=Pseudonocardia ailaonensis TaxID=367279 RepID=A0ABN2N115_9PSEU
MWSRGPLFTLLAVVALGTGLLLSDAYQARSPDTPGAAPAAAAAPAATTAPPPTAPPPSSTPPVPVVDQAVWAGRSPGREVTVAIATKAGRAVAYVCDGRSIEAWLDGTLTGDRLELAGPAGRVTGTATRGAVTGEITVGDRRWTFDARAAGTPAGLYEGRADVRGTANRIGWIVLPDGTQVGLTRSAGTVRPAPPLVSGAADLDGVPVTVRALTGTEPVTTG